MKAVDGIRLRFGDTYEGNLMPPVTMALPLRLSHPDDHPVKSSQVRGDPWL
jgi:hypothetical protein